MDDGRVAVRAQCNEDGTRVSKYISQNDGRVADGGDGDMDKPSEEAGGNDNSFDDVFVVQVSDASDIDH